VYYVGNTIGGATATPSCWYWFCPFVFVYYLAILKYFSPPKPGASLGRLTGELLLLKYPGVSPGGYAVVGAAALTGSATGTASTAVIVFEITGQIEHLLPVLVAVLIANGIAAQITDTIYDRYVCLKCLYFGHLTSDKTSTFLGVSISYLKKLPTMPTIRFNHSYFRNAGDVMTPVSSPEMYEFEKELEDIEDDFGWMNSARGILRETSKTLRVVEPTVLDSRKTLFKTLPRIGAGEWFFRQRG
jgi:hypothetical protein